MWGSRICAKIIAQFTRITSMVYFSTVIVNTNNKINVMLLFVIGPNITIFKFASK